MRYIVRPSSMTMVLTTISSADTEPPSFDFSAWLTAAVTDGLVIGVQRLTDPAPHLEMTP